MKNYQLLQIKKAWNELKSVSGSKGYYIPLVKNIKKIDIELEALDLIKEKTKEFEQFVKDKDALLIKYSKKDASGESVKTAEVIDGQQYFKYDVEESTKGEFEEAGKKLIEDNKKVLEEMTEREKNYIDAMNSDCTVSFVMIKEEDLPETMSPDLLELLYDFVEFK